MDRRAFLAVATAGGLIAMPAVARAQQAGKVYRIGNLGLGSGPGDGTEAFRQGLRELGYVEGRNLIIEYRWAAGKVERLPELAAELVRLKVEVIVGSATPALRGTSATKLFVDEMRGRARQMGIQLVVQEANEAGDLPGAFAAMQRERAQALVVQVSPLTGDNTERIVELGAQHRLPAMYEVRSFVEAGGLVSYGPSLPEIFRRAAFYVDRILKGAKPADLPIEQPTKFELVINMKAAKALGLTIPPALLVRADQVIP